MNKVSEYFYKEIHALICQTALYHHNASTSIGKRINELEFRFNIEKELLNFFNKNQVDFHLDWRLSAGKQRATGLEEPILLEASRENIWNFMFGMGDDIDHFTEVIQTQLKLKHKYSNYCFSVITHSTQHNPFKNPIMNGINEVFSDEESVATAFYDAYKMSDKDKKLLIGTWFC